jgi:hypothetical protein
LRGPTSTFATNLGAPSGLAFNSSGTLFESDYGGGNNGAEISEFTTNGLESSFITNGLGTPIGIAFDNVILPVTLPVPESSSFPLLVLAALIGVILMVVRRKNSKVGA